MDVIGHQAPGIYLQAFYPLTVTEAVENNITVTFSGKDIDPFSYGECYEVSAFGIMKLVFSGHDISLLEHGSGSKKLG